MFWIWLREKWLKGFTENISCECKCKFDGRKCNLDQKWNNNKRWCKYKKHDICEKDYIWNPATCGCKNGKCLGSIIDDSVNTCDEIINKVAKLNNEERKTVPTKNHTCYYFDDLK